jgi:hypothetical protein
MPVQPRKGGPYSLFCTSCNCWVPNTANYEMKKEGFYAYSHSCHKCVCDMQNSEISDADYQLRQASLHKA